LIFFEIISDKIIVDNFSNHSPAQTAKIWGGNSLANYKIFVCEFFQLNTFEKSQCMKVSNFLFLLIFSPLILVAQSKKEEIVLLNNRIENKSLQDELNKTKEEFKSENNKLQDESKALTNNLNLTQIELDKLKQSLVLLESQSNQIKLNKTKDSLILTKEITRLNEANKKLSDSLQLNKVEFSNWVERNLSMKIPKIEPFFKIDTNLISEIKNELKEDFWLGTYTINEIKIKANGVHFNLSDDDYSKYLFMNSEFLIVSYHLTAGDDGNSIFINLKTMTPKLLEGYFIKSFESEHIVSVEKDYYDNKGHVWETGTYDLKTGKYTMESIEH
jgi:hypothetical protein